VEIAVSCISARRGWLQQLFDQYSGQRRFDAARCCSSSSPAPLKNEQGERRMQNAPAVMALGLAEVS